MNLIFFSAFLHSIFFPPSAQLAQDYIEQYKYIAVSEMQRTGIPASIKLSQGILESNLGRSELARNAKNHFGIKCGSRWDGGAYYLEDDDRDKQGQIVPSCFRSFSSIEESYIAHSEFLLPSRNSRYAFLFDLDSRDYKAWANGLKKAGYATDRKYAKKLIKVIEKYKLYQFDESHLFNNSEVVVNSEEEINPQSKTKRSRIKVSSTTESTNFRVRSYAVKNVNRINYVSANGGESLIEIARKLGLDSKKLLDYNEEIGFESRTLTAGEMIFLQKKKRSYVGEVESHIFKDGDSMYSISQMYGLKLANLYAKNKMPKGSQPLIGEVLYLKSIPKKGVRPKYLKKEKLKIEEPGVLFADDQAVK